MKWPSLTLIFSVIFLGYTVHAIWSLAQLFILPKCLSGDLCLKSYLHSNPDLQVVLYTSVKSSPVLENEVSLVDYWQSFDYSLPFEKKLQVKVPRVTRNNGSLFLHMFVTPKLKSDPDFTALQRNPKVVTERIRLTEYHVPEAATFQLLGSSEDKDTQNKAKSGNKNGLIPVSHLKTKITFNILTDVISLPARSIPTEIARLLRLTQNREYLPVIQYDFLNNRLRDLVEIKTNSSSMNITISYIPVGIGKLRLMQQVQDALRSLMAFGFSEKDVDEVKGIFADTNLYLLCVTVFIAAIHLLFDFLAFKNDVSFWRRKQTFVGLSTRTVAWRAFSQVVIFLYLMDEDTSLMVLIPSGIAAIIEIWKVQKVVSVEISFTNYFIPVLNFRSKGTTEDEQRTQQFDAESMKYLSYLLYPLCICGAIYSLLYEPHKSWYSWSLHSLVNGVYAFGFLFMLPQLFVNYKLKSVAHLPWKAFMYKAFNTFIDDLFAFIITMPTAHRVACFRDDIVFLIYLYQRWLYPVDKSRIDYALSIDEEVQDKKVQ